jgi:hypothetical protein
MKEPSMHVCDVQTAEGVKHYLTMLPLEIVFRKGLIPEAIIGVLLRPLTDVQSITPEVFARSAPFVKFMHEVIAKYGEQESDCIAEARRLGSGWVYIIDARTKTPQGAVPPEDIFGAFEVRDGQVVPGTYRESSRHMILSNDGFFRLSAEMHSHLLRELQALVDAA